MPLRPLNRLKTSGLFVFWNKIVHLFQPLALGCTLARPSHGRSGRGLLRNWVRQRPTTRLRQLWGILRTTSYRKSLTCFVGERRHSPRYEFSSLPGPAPLFRIRASARRCAPVRLRFFPAPLVTSFPLLHL